MKDSETHEEGDGHQDRGDEHGQRRRGLGGEKGEVRTQQEPGEDGSEDECKAVG